VFRVELDPPKPAGVASRAPPDPCSIEYGSSLRNLSILTLSPPEGVASRGEDTPNHERHLNSTLDSNPPTRAGVASRAPPELAGAGALPPPLLPGPPPRYLALPLARSLWLSLSRSPSLSLSLSSPSLSSSILSLSIYFHRFGALFCTKIDGFYRGSILNLTWTQHVYLRIVGGPE